MAKRATPKRPQVSETQVRPGHGRERPGDQRRRGWGRRVSDTSGSGEGATPKATGRRTPSRDTPGQAKLSTSNLGGGRILPETPACQGAVREAGAHLAPDPGRQRELPLATEVSHQGQDLPGPLGMTRVCPRLSLPPGRSLGPPYPGTHKSLRTWPRRHTAAQPPTWPSPSVGPACSAP